MPAMCPIAAYRLELLLAYGKASRKAVPDQCTPKLGAVKLTGQFERRIRIQLTDDLADQCGIIRKVQHLGELSQPIRRR